MKKLFLTFSLLAVTLTAMAIPAYRSTRTVKNSDGTELTITLRGDETFHYHTTLDGTPVRKNANGDWVADLRDVKTLWSEASAKRNVHRRQLAKSVSRAMKAPRRAGATTGYTGTKRGLLILVNFSDKKFINSDEQAQTIYNQMLNGLDNPYGRNYGSVREYFRAQSYNQFDIEFDIAGPVTVSGTMASYGANDSEGNDKAPGKMVAEAIALVDDDINFKNYDWDGDGEVENIYVIYAGFGEAYDGADENTIWPHQWQLSDRYNYGKAVTADGVTIDTYACGSELMGTKGTTLDGIGTMCHEYSHCLGLPDFYDTEGSNFGMNTWSVMDYGCYNNSGFCPAGYTAYERWFSGWLEPTELNSATAITDMPNIEENPVAYIVYNDQNHNEYYLLENHQKVGWDKYAQGHGMLVVHADYDEYAWYSNVVNNTSSRQRMTIIPADNKCSTATLSGDPYPNNGKNTALTDETTPAAKLYRANTDGEKLMHKPIENITEVGGLISFDFMSGMSTLETPVVNLDESKMAITSTGFLALWEEVEGAVSYNLRWAEKEQGGGGDPESTLVLYEDFEKFFAENDGSSDISSQLDNYTSTPGWTGYAIYKGINGAKLATGKKTGNLKSPMFSDASGNLTLLIDCYDYKTDGSTPTLSFYDAAGIKVYSESFEPDEEYILWFSFTENVPESMSVEISTTAGKRIYLGGIFGFDAQLSEDEVNEFINQVYASPKHIKKLSPKLSTAHRVPEVNPITGITTTSYEFTDLTPGKQYTWQVQAVDADGNVSGWSETVKVVLLESTNIEAIRELQQSARSKVYDLSGRQVDGGLQLRRGLYIINGKKVAVK